MFHPEFLLTSLMVVLIPGTGVIYTVSTGLVLGQRASLYAALGCTLGIVPHLLATIFGLAAVLHTSAVAFQFMKYAGVAYLFYLAVATWRDRSRFQLSAEASEMSFSRTVVKGILLNLLNPKLTIFFLAFLPQFISLAEASPMFSMIQLSVVFMAMTLAVFILYGLLANAFRSFIVESARAQAVLRYIVASAFGGLGLRLALDED